MNTYQIFVEQTNAGSEHPARFVLVDTREAENAVAAIVAYNGSARVAPGCGALAIQFLNTDGGRACIDSWQPPTFNCYVYRGERRIMALPFPRKELWE